MTPELFQHLLQEVSTAGSPPLDAETAPREVMDPTVEASEQQAQSDESMWSAPELMGKHPWFDSDQAAPKTSEAMTVEATEQQEPLAEMASYEASLQAMVDQQPPQGLEAVIQEPTPLQAEEDPFEMERRMYDQQMQQLEQMLDPDRMSGFGSGMMGSGFGPGP
jgi:hypothetical protein